MLQSEKTNKLLKRTQKQHRRWTVWKIYISICFMRRHTPHVKPWSHQVGSQNLVVKGFLTWVPDSIPDDILEQGSLTPSMLLNNTCLNSLKLLRIKKVWLNKFNSGQKQEFYLAHSSTPAHGGGVDNIVSGEQETTQKQIHKAAEIWDQWREDKGGAEKDNGCFGPGHSCAVVNRDRDGMANNRQSRKHETREMDWYVWNC